MEIRPLTILSEEENMFREMVKEFAEEEIRPHVMEMDQKAVFRRDIVDKFFELGIMGVEIPESHGGTGSSFFMAILAVEALATVDASAAIYVDVQNTLVNNAILRFGGEELKKKLGADYTKLLRWQ